MERGVARRGLYGGGAHTGGTQKGEVEAGVKSPSDLAVLGCVLERARRLR